MVLLPVCASPSRAVDRGFESVHGELAYRTAQVEAVMGILGHPVRVFETYRTPERQADLYEQGRSRPGPVVTWTRESYHQQGLAVDFVFLGPDPWGSEHPWDLLRVVAEAVGLQRPSDSDLGHFIYAP